VSMITPQSCRVRVSFTPTAIVVLVGAMQEGGPAGRCSWAVQVAGKETAEGVCRY
jgi:hypothetical protein